MSLIYANIKSRIENQENEILLAMMSGEAEIYGMDLSEYQIIIREGISTIVHPKGNHVVHTRRLERLLGLKEENKK